MKILLNGLIERRINFMKKFVVINYITTYKEVDADTREEAIELALTESPHEAKERTVVKRCGLNELTNTGRF